MNIVNLHKILINEPRFRHQQVEKAIYEELISNWNEASSLPKALREKLGNECSLNIEAEILSEKSHDKTLKAIVVLEDGLKIETVLIKGEKGRNTVCVSSQVGCPMGCSFCATGKMGLKRNLTKYEIIEQVLLFARLIKRETNNNERITNVVFMGMGEPFLNYENVILAIKKINEAEGLNIGARHISISTCGIIEGIKKMALEKMQINLAISLHATNDDLRTKIMPVNKNNNISKILKAVDFYIEKTNRKVMFEYLLIDGLNDSPEQAKELTELMKKPLYMVNLIAYNETGIYKSSNRETINKFKDILKRERINVTERFKYGTNIKAACGQLITDQERC